MAIPFNRPYVAGNELRYIEDALRAGHASGDGPYTARASSILEGILGAARVLLTTSCTDALEMSAVLAGVGPGDEVVVPAFTFVSTINAFVLRGARPVFIDVRSDTLDLDESRLESAITSRTKVVVPVHYAGVACEMDAIMAIAARHDVTVIEDNAHGLFGAYRGRPLGAFGAMSALSFHETKNVSCGEGGALVLNDASYVERAEVVRSKGTDRSRFLRGQVDKYTWVDIGSSYLPSDLLAAFLCAQLEARETIQRRRAEIWLRYEQGLREWAADRGVRFPTVPAHCDQAFHMFHLVLPTPAGRDGLIEHLRRRGIHAVFHYQPLHLSAMGRRYGGAEGSCPVTEAVCDRLVRLPFYTGMTGSEVDTVIEAVLAFAA